MAVGIMSEGHYDLMWCEVPKGRGGAYEGELIINTELMQDILKRKYPAITVVEQPVIQMPFHLFKIARHLEVDADSNFFSIELKIFSYN